MKVTFLGSGTSTGVPVVGCHCGVCRSPNPKNQRLRQSVKIEKDGRHILIDTTPDLRLQLLRDPIPRIDCILFTHSHADHMMGLDDIRPFNFFHRSPVVAYASHWTAQAIRNSFSYIWADTQMGGGKPQLDLRVVDGPFEHEGIEIVPIPVRHGEWTIFGYRIGPFAYITDTNGIPDASRRLLEGVDTLALDGLRIAPAHSTHFTIFEAIAAAREVGAKETWLIHLTHDVDHDQVQAQLPPSVHLAWDGLTLEFD
ncbi:MAG TPA: MBL fold metallo-hydrolase [Thermoanaerobaculia bacterium]|nr:MBL fold metallo-hydrolase [Thermoanaerobaculia bacterium]